MSENEITILDTSYKCPTCNQFIQVEHFKLKYLQYLAKDIKEMFRNKELKKLTFFHTYDHEEDTWCEIDLLNQLDNFSVFTKGHNYFSWIPDHPLAHLNDFLEEKTKIYSDTVSSSEILDLLDDLYYKYDIRLLDKAARSEHPAYHMLVEYTEHTDVILELADGRIDQVTLWHPSVASNIVNLCIARNSLLSKWFRC